MENQQCFFFCPTVKILIIALKLRRRDSQNDVKLGEMNIRFGVVVIERTIPSIHRCCLTTAQLV